MIYYVDAFPERLHHPKEDLYLFRPLRLRHPEAGPLLDRLEAERRAGAERIRTLEQAYAALHAGRGPGVRCVRRGGQRLRELRIASTCGRKRLEVLPLAERYLTPDDWGDRRCGVRRPHDAALRRRAGRAVQGTLPPHRPPRAPAHRPRFRARPEGVGDAIAVVGRRAKPVEDRRDHLSLRRQRGHDPPPARRRRGSAGAAGGRQPLDRRAARQPDRRDRDRATRHSGRSARPRPRPRSARRTAAAPTMPRSSAARTRASRSS